MSDSPERLPSGTLPQEIPVVYGNGFQLGLTNSDVALVVQLDNIPQLRLAVSYTTAKSLRNKLDELVNRFESMTDHVVMTTEEIAQKMAAANGK